MTDYLSCSYILTPPDINPPFCSNTTEQCKPVQHFEVGDWTAAFHFQRQQSTEQLGCTKNLRQGSALRFWTACMMLLSIALSCSIFCLVLFLNKPWAMWLHFVLSLFSWMLGHHAEHLCSWDCTVVYNYFKNIAVIPICPAQNKTITEFQFLSTDVQDATTS